jgi:hypothetical protein
MADRPDFLLRGDRARLFPSLADTSREGRITSIFLALLPHIPHLAQEIFATAGLRIGQRAHIDCFTEIVLPGQEDGPQDRPDGLIRIATGRTEWTALVEAKIGKAKINSEQVQRYVRLARQNGIDAVITISNEFVVRADHSPASVPKTLLRKTDLLHWSWTWIATECEILALQKAVDDPEQAFLLREFLTFLSHPGTGVERVTQMGPHWKDLIQKVSHQGSLTRSLPEVEEAVGSWFEEIRDLTLQLSRHVGQSVDTVIERKLKDDPIARLKAGIADLAESQCLTASFRIPDAASDLDVTADLARKTLSAGMRLKAPGDRKSTKARVNWLLRMIREDDPRLWVRAHWPGRTPPTAQQLTLLRARPEALQPDTSDAAPHMFEVILLEECAKRFAGRRTFIEDLERIVPEFYNIVGQNLRDWRPAPPKPVAKQEEFPEESTAPEPET